MKTNKTLWIISQNSGTPAIGGVQRHYFFSQFFKENQIETLIVCNGDNHLLREKLKPGKQILDGVTFYAIPTMFKFKAGVYRFFQMFEFGIRCFLLPLKQLQKPDYIILSSMSIFPLPAVLFLKWWYKAKFIFEVRDLWPLTPVQLMGVSKFNPLVLVMGWLEKIAYRKADRIVTTLPGSEPYINAKSKDPEKLILIPNGIPKSYLKMEL